MRREWIVCGVLAGSMCIYWLSPLAQNAYEDIDLAIYQGTIAEMRQGNSYYSSMSDALNSYITADGQGPFTPSSIRAFRLPTLFLVWASVPGTYTWPFVLVVVVCTATLVGLLWRPFAGLGVMLWELLLVYPTALLHLPGFAYPPRWGYVEIWVVPLILGAMFAMRKGVPAVALVLVLISALCRELAFPCLITGAVAAWRRGSPIQPWVAATVACLGFYLWHAQQVLPHLLAHGNEAPLVDIGGVTGVVMNTDAGAGVLAAGLLGLGFIAWPTVTRRWSPSWWIALPLIGGLPIVGLIASREYWSLLVVPPAISLFGEPRTARYRSARDPGRAADDHEAGAPRMERPSASDDTH